jgi:hypothetical protein
MSNPTSSCIRCQNPIIYDASLRVPVQAYRKGEIYWVDETVTNVIHEVLGGKRRPAFHSTSVPSTIQSTTSNSRSVLERIKTRPCIVIQGGLKPIICLMAAPTTWTFLKFSRNCHFLFGLCQITFPLTSLRLMSTQIQTWRMLKSSLSIRTRSTGAMSSCMRSPTKGLFGLSKTQVPWPEEDFRRRKWTKYVLRFGQSSLRWRAIVSIILITSEIYCESTR